MSMTKPARHLLTALAATLLLAITISTASARSFSVSNQAIRATWTSLNFESEGAGITIRCQLTLEGSFHTRTIAKVARTLIGAVTRANFKQEACTNGAFSAFNGVERYNGVTPTNSLPWHLTYHSFVGSLPNITIIRLLLSRFRLGFRDSGGLCTGQYGTATDNVVLNGNREAGGTITSLEGTPGENRATLFRRDAGILCPSPLELNGRGNVTLLGNTTRITVTLI